MTCSLLGSSVWPPFTSETEMWSSPATLCSPYGFPLTESESRTNRVEYSNGNILIYLIQNARNNVQSLITDSKAFHTVCAWCPAVEPKLTKRNCLPATVYLIEGRMLFIGCLSLETYHVEEDSNLVTEKYFERERISQGITPHTCQQHHHAIRSDPQHR